MISQGNTGSLGHVRALPIPTKPTSSTPPVKPRAGHKPVKHGTPRGYERHRQLGTKPCEDCLRAVKAKPAPVKAKPAKPIEHGTTRGYAQHKTQGVPICGECRTANTDYHRDRREAQRASGHAEPTFDLDAAVKAYQAGKSLRAIAAEIGINRETLRRHLRRLGLTPGPTERLDVDKAEQMLTEGHDLAHIGRELGFAYFTVYKALKKRGHVFPRRNAHSDSVDHAQVVADASEGMRPGQLATKHGVSERTIRRHLQKAEGAA